MDTKTIIETAEEHLIHTYNRYQIVLDKGDGVHLYDTDGKEYLDFGAGIAVFALGYNNKEYNDALKTQIDKLLLQRTGGKGGKNADQSDRNGQSIFYQQRYGSC